MDHYGASSAWVVSNRDYTEQAYTLAKSNGVRLVNREQLIDMILAVNPAQYVSKPVSAVDKNSASCAGSCYD
jgi:restriction system protein